MAGSGRRDSVVKWMQAKDVIEVVNALCKKYGVKKLSLDEPDGQKKSQSIFTHLVQNCMVGSKFARRAAIVNRQGENYASSENFKFSPDEIRAIADHLHEPSSIATSGINFGDEHFFYSDSKPNVIHGRNKVDKEERCIIVWSRLLMLIAICDKNKLDEAEEMMLALRRYFVDQGI